MKTKETKRYPGIENTKQDRNFSGHSKYKYTQDNLLEDIFKFVETN